MAFSIPNAFCFESRWRSSSSRVICLGILEVLVTGGSATSAAAFTPMITSKIPRINWGKKHCSPFLSSKSAISPQQLFLQYCQKTCIWAVCHKAVMIKGNGKMSHGLAALKMWSKSMECGRSTLTPSSFHLSLSLIKSNYAAIITHFCWTAGRWARSSSLKIQHFSKLVIRIIFSKMETNIPVFCKLVFSQIYYSLVFDRFVDVLALRLPPSWLTVLLLAACC